MDLRKQNIGFIFQNFNLIDDLNVSANVDLPLLYLGVPKKERKLRVAQALELVGLESRASTSRRNFPVANNNAWRWQDL